MKRRELLKIGAAAPGAPLAFAQQAAPPPAKAATNPLTAPGWRPSVLDNHQNETVIALNDLIIPATDTPGAKAALVNRYIDQLLRDGRDEQRQQFLEGLGWLDGYAISKHSKPFVKLTPDEQKALLRTLDGAEDQALQAGARFFRMIKGATASVYYATEIGFRELNKGGRVPATYGCKHPEHA